MKIEKAILAVINSGDSAVKKELQKNQPEDIIQKAADRLMKDNRTRTNTVSSSLDSRFRLIEVQYNPSSLSLSASGENTILESSRETEQKKQVQQNIKPGTVTLSMELTVEGEKTREWSENLLEMLQSNVTQAVIFCWGNMIFPGKLTKADTEYTMFSLGGVPLLGKVSVSIQQETPEEGAYWKKAFEACFGM